MYLCNFEKMRFLVLVIIVVVISASLAGSAIASDDSETLADEIDIEQLEIERVRSEMADLDARISIAEQNLDYNREQLADARMMLADAENQYYDTLRRYEDRITSLYKMGGEKFLDVMFSGEGLNDAASRISYLVTISENDKKLVAQVKDEAETVRELHDRIDSLKQESAEGLDDLKMQRMELAGNITTRQQQIDEKNEQLAQARLEEMLAAASSDPGSVSIFDSMTAPSLIFGNDKPPEGFQPSGMVLTGIASWYGPGFNGNTTANGEIYDMFAYTAAHKTLPFNTWLKVTYNGRSVFVRINDRGPYIGDRFLDLSAAAAGSIGLTGVGYVTAEIYR